MNDDPDDKTDRPFWTLRPAERLARLRRAREAHRFEPRERHDRYESAVTDYDPLEEKRNR